MKFKFLNEKVKESKEPHASSTNFNRTAYLKSKFSQKN